MSIENVGRYSNVSSISSNAFSARSLSDEFGLFGAIGCVSRSIVYIDYRAQFGLRFSQKLIIILESM